MFCFLLVLYFVFDELSRMYETHGIFLVYSFFVLIMYSICYRDIFMQNHHIMTPSFVAVFKFQDALIPVTLFVK